MERITYILMTFTIIIVVLGLIIRKNRLLFAVQTAWMLVIIGCNSGGVDFLTNESIYQFVTKDTLTSEGIFMVGYNCLALMAKEAGMDFITFNFILSTVATLLIIRVVLKFSNNPCMVMSLIYIYPLVDNVIQKRWYYALGILVAAIPLLYQRKGKKNLLIYSLLCLLACQFHSAAIFYLAFVVFEFIPSKYKNKFIFTVFLVELLGINLLPKILMRYNIFGGKVNLYLNEMAVNSSMIKFFFWSLWHLACVGIMYYATRHDLGKDKNANFIWHLNVLSLLILPLYSFDPVFTRLFRVVFIFNYIYVTNKFVMRNFVIKGHALLVNALQLAVTISSFVIFYVLTGLGFEQVIPIFQKNIFINWLFM